MAGLTRHTGLCVPALELLLCQVCEADADRGQGLCVVCLHDVTQKPHPELLGQGWGEGGPELGGKVTHGHPRRLVRLHPQCGLHPASPELS
jgi:hypothetical protein